MYKILLVDDERWIVESLKGTLDWTAAGFEIVGMAYNGIEAWERIKELRPDIAFIDIRMPGMNGLELVKKLQETGSAVRCVMASGYAEFDYAKQALQYGAAGYCLKPFNKAEIEELLARLQEQIARERRVVESELLHLFQDRETTPEAYARMERLLDKINAPWDRENGAFVAVVQSSDPCNLFDRWAAVSIRIGRGKTAFLLYGRHHRDVMNRLAEPIPEGVRGMGLTPIFYNMNEIHEKIEEAGAASYLYFVSGRPFIGELIAAGADDLDAAALRMLEEGLERKDAKYVHESFAIIERHFRTGRYDTGHAFRFYHVMLSRIYRMADGFTERFLFGFDELTAAFDDVFAMIRYLEQLAMDSFHSAGMGDKTGEATFDQILQYVQDHFRENVSIQDISRKFFMHPNYVSHLFKKELQVNFTKFVTDKRMEFACEMLRSTSFAVSDIAEKSGYNDYFYFAKMFKRHTGVTPTEYRLRES
ncbi:response regulator [Paenibacillus sp. H1-7]|uniref:response regulator transcription factor n=1 Tax=Paenibacillus sp. H1-7 TaxID=2282849 RepID=UPI001EF889AE|nr:response regulator [Paenibacillus sp. H1-7]ULL13554.1 response regulator [Paenibacillus sp. H1-7]